MRGFLAGFLSLVFASVGFCLLAVLNGVWLFPLVFSLIGAEAADAWFPLLMLAPFLLAVLEIVLFEILRRRFRNPYLISLREVERTQRLLKKVVPPSGPMLGLSPPTDDAFASLLTVLGRLSQSLKEAAASPSEIKEGLPDDLRMTVGLARTLLQGLPTDVAAFHSIHGQFEAVSRYLLAQDIGAARWTLNLLVRSLERLPEYGTVPTQPQPS